MDQSFVSGVRSRPGHKRKWVSLPLDEGSRDDADKTPGGGPEPVGDTPDPASSNQTLRNSRAHDGSLSKCTQLSSWLTALLFALIWFVVCSPPFSKPPSVPVEPSSGTASRPKQFPPLCWSPKHADGSLCLKPVRSGCPIRIVPSAGRSIRRQPERSAHTTEPLKVTTSTGWRDGSSSEK